MRIRKFDVEGDLLVAAGRDEDGVPLVTVWRLGVTAWRTAGALP